MRDETRSDVVRSLVMGAYCCPVGLLVGLWVSTNSIGDGWQGFFLYSGATSFVVPALTWYVLAERGKSRSMIRGALAGVLGAALSHYFSWYSMIAVARISYLLTGNPVGSLAEPPMGLLAALGGAAVYTGFSLFIVGWLTLPVGLVIGLLYQRKLKAG